MRAALAFLTPIGGARSPSPGSVAWFPVVGALIGLALGGLWWVAGRAWPHLVAAALVVAADLAVTGMLHFDGLVDCADGLIPHLDRGRRLAVMASPETGAFGVAAGAVVLLTRWAALVSIPPSPLLLGGLWCLSRTSMGVILRTQPYARAEGGLASAFVGQVPWVPLGAGVAVAIAAVAFWRVPAGPVAAIAAALSAAGVVAVARNRIGGFTGDVIGAAGVVAETIGLVVASARW